MDKTGYEDRHEVEEDYPLMERDSWLGLLGITCWFLLLSAIATRLIRNPKQTQRLLKLHKVFAGSAFAVATLHGIIALFG